MSDLIRFKPKWNPNDSQPYPWTIAPPSSTLKSLASNTEEATQDDLEEGAGKKRKLDSSGEEEQDGKEREEEELFNPLLFRALEGVGRGLEREERERMKEEEKEEGGDGE